MRLGRLQIRGLLLSRNLDTRIIYTQADRYNRYKVDNRKKELEIMGT